jgi:hypothetical protein
LTELLLVFRDVVDGSFNEISLPFRLLRLRAILPFKSRCWHSSHIISAHFSIHSSAGNDLLFVCTGRGSSGASGAGLFTAVMNCDTFNYALSSSERGGEEENTRSFSCVLIILKIKTSQRVTIASSHGLGSRAESWQ